MPEPAGVDLGWVLTLPPQEAVEYLRGREIRVSDGWRDVWAAEHSRVFTVARMADRDLLGDVRDHLERVIAEGITTAVAERDLEAALREAGWWGADPARPDVMLGSPYRVRTIVRTNIQTAYNAGRYRRQREVMAARPFWMYDAVLDGVTRQSHREMDGVVYRADNPIWQRIYPPNGFNCRCRTRSVTEREVRERGLTVLEGEDAPFGFTPDEGWDYNPGEAAWPGAGG